MSTPWQIATRVPQQGDSFDLLIARLLTTHLTEVVLPSATANAGRTSDLLKARGFRGMIVHVSITGYGGGGGIIPYIEAKTRSLDSTRRLRA